MPQWTLTTTEIQALLRRENIVAWMGSPLLNPEPVPDRELVSKILPNAPELREALLRIARPEIMQGVLQFPPDFSGVHWFYGQAGDTRLAGHGRDQSGRHVMAWPITDQEVVQAMETSLAVQAPAVVDGFALALNCGGLEALAGIVDLLQEGILKAALDRRPPPEFHFTAKELGECLQHGSQGLDLRWMVQRLKCLAPVPLKNDPSGLEKGLQNLVKQQMLSRKNSHYRPVSRFYAACSLLCGGSGLCALNTRRLVLQAGKPLAWERQHTAALRGIGSLWLFEFSDMNADDFSVKLGDVTAGLLHERLMAGLSIKKKSFVPEPPAAAKIRSCPQCGLALQSAAEFCPVCAKKSKPFSAPATGPVQATRPVKAASETVTCGQCGTALASGSKFCIQCGAAVKPAVTVAIPAGTPVGLHCPRCKAPMSSKMRFCTQCGTPVK